VFHKFKLVITARREQWLKTAETELRAKGISNFGEMRSRGFSRATTPAHCELFFGHRPMTLARWPNEGAWEKIAGFPAGTGKGDDHGCTRVIGFSVTKKAQGSSQIKFDATTATVAHPS